MNSLLRSCLQRRTGQHQSQDSRHLCHAAGVQSGRVVLGAGRVSPLSGASGNRVSCLQLWPSPRRGRRPYRRDRQRHPQTDAGGKAAGLPWG